MKKKILYLLGILSAAVLIVVILLGNKAKVEAGIIKEKNGVYSVAVEKVSLQKISSELSFVGLTEACNDVELISETAGKVEKVFAENGDRVSNNSIILQVDNDILQANYKLAEAALDKAKLDLQRFEALMNEGNLSASDLENSRIGLKNAEAQYILAKKYLSNTSVKSPINGVLVNRYVNIGSTVAPGTSIANIVDVSKLKIKIEVPEKDITKIKSGSSAIVTSNLFPGSDMEAKVKSISVKADGAHNYSVELMIDNPRGILPAGMYLDVKFNFTTPQNVLSVSRYSLVGSVKNPKVFVVQNNKAVERNIIISDVIGDRLIIAGGLTDGETIVIEGQNNLDNGSSVIIKEEKSF